MPGVSLCALPSYVFRRFKQTQGELLLTQGRTQIEAPVYLLSGLLTFLCLPKLSDQTQAYEGDPGPAALDTNNISGMPNPNSGMA